MPPTPTVTELDTSVFKGLSEDDSDICTVEVTVPTGMEDVCAEEVQQKLGVTCVVVAAGRAFFDISVQESPKVLELRSVEHVHVVIHMESRFPLTKDRNECFSAFYCLAERPLWRKGVRVWQQVFGDLEQPPFEVDLPLTKSCEVPKPLLDLRLLKEGSPVSLNLPQEIKDMREEYRIREGLPDVPVKSNSKRRGQGAKKSDQNALNMATKTDGRAGVASNGLQQDLLVDDTRHNSNEVQDVNSRSDTSSSDTRVEDRSEAKIQSPTKDNWSQQESENVTIELTNCCLDNDSVKPLSQNENTSKFEAVSESSKENFPDTTASSISVKVEVDVTVSNPDPPSANSTSVMDSRSEEEKGQGNSGPGFRVTCNRTGMDHVFGSQEAARQLGAAVNDRFGWPVRLNNHQIEIILNITETTVHVSLTLSREPLFRRNLVSFGPTNLRATLCYALLHLGRPKEGDVVMDHMCGGASIPLEGALSFPGCFHMGGDVNEKAVKRARENLDHSAVTLGRSVAADVALWDSTRLPLRTSTVDVVVSDLPFGRRSGSKLDNRVLYLRALQETARVTRPGTGRAVLLTHDKNSLNKNLTLVRQYWRCPSVRTINIGGLYAGVFLLVRTAALYTGLAKADDKAPSSCCVPEPVVRVDDVTRALYTSLTKAGSEAP